MNEQYSFESYLECCREILIDNAHRKTTDKEAEKRIKNLRKEFYFMNLSDIKRQKELGLITRKEAKNAKEELRAQYDVKSPLEKTVMAGETLGPVGIVIYKIFT